MKKIKVLHISPDSVIHGTERHILSILKYINRDEFDNTVAVPDEGDLVRELKAMKIKTFIAGRKHGYRSKLEGIFGKDSRRLYRLIRQEKYDIVHSHLNSFGGFVGKLAGARSIVHTRHGVFWSEEDLKNISAGEKYMQQMKSKLFDRTIAIGDYERRTLIDKFNYDGSKIDTTINGVDVEEINLKADKFRTKTELFGTNDIIAGLVVRLERQKGLDILLEAVHGIKDKIKGVRFVIIGSGSMKEELMQRIKSMELDKLIMLTDYKKNVLDYIYNFDFMILTSLWEGLSYAVQEAMALSKPVIALTSPNVSGVREIIVNGETGYLIESDYVKKLGEYILLLSSDMNKRLKLGRAARIREKDFFPEWRTARDMEKVYRDIHKQKTNTGN